MWWAIRVSVRSVIVPSRACKAAVDVVGRVDRLADVVQERRQQEFLVVGPLVAGQLEDLEAVVEGVPLGVVLRALLHAFEGLEQHPVKLEAVDVVLDRARPRRRGRRRGLRLARSASSSAIEARSIALPVIELLKT